MLIKKQSRLKHNTSEILQNENDAELQQDKTVSKSKQKQQ